MAQDARAFASRESLTLSTSPYDSFPRKGDEWISTDGPVDLEEWR